MTCPRVSERTPRQHATGMLTPISGGKGDKAQNDKSSGGIISSVMSFFGGGRATPDEKRTRSPWELPDVDEDEVKDFVKDMQKDDAGGSSTTGKKRKASDPDAALSPKRPRRRSSGGSDYRMSGAL
jgi:hypothetical protein